MKYTFHWAQLLASSRTSYRQKYLQNLLFGELTSSKIARDRPHFSFFDVFKKDMQVTETGRREMREYRKLLLVTGSRKYIDGWSD